MDHLLLFLFAAPAVADAAPATSAAGMWWVSPAAAQPNNSPNEKLNIACIGVGGQGQQSVNACRGENIVALSDVDERMLGGKEKFRDANVYKDWRKLFDEMEGKIDAVTVATPDHMHGSIALPGGHLRCGAGLHDCILPRQVENLPHDNRRNRRQNNVA